MEKLNTLEEAAVSDVKVANATTRPNASGFYGGGGLSSEKVKALFDKYPDLLRVKLNEVIVFANALLDALNQDADNLNTAYSQLSYLEGNLNSLAERVGHANLSEDTRFTTNVLANAILKLSEDLRKTETYPFDVVYRDDEGILYFMNGNKILASVDLPIETLVRGIRVEADNIILTLENGADVSVPIDAITERIEEAIFAEELPKAMKDSIVTEGGIEASLEGGKLKLVGGGSGAGGGTTVTVEGTPVSVFAADVFIGEKIGDIQSALDELHAYAQTLVGGDAE